MRFFRLLDRIDGLPFRVAGSTDDGEDFRMDFFLKLCR